MPAAASTAPDPGNDSIQPATPVKLKRNRDAERVDDIETYASMPVQRGPGTPIAIRLARGRELGVGEVGQGDDLATRAEEADGAIESPGRRTRRRRTDRVVRRGWWGRSRRAVRVARPGNSCGCSAGRPMTPPSRAAGLGGCARDSARCRGGGQRRCPDGWPRRSRGRVGDHRLADRARRDDLVRGRPTGRPPTATPMSQAGVEVVAAAPTGVSPAHPTTRRLRSSRSRSITESALASLRIWWITVLIPRGPHWHPCLR